ncbi:MAG: hypothetical protein JSS04_10140 [Proteobacteria bacterium]|nr:hypothetical protein [Pseudomonadota bacterium]
MNNTDDRHLYLAAFEKENPAELDIDVCLLNLSDKSQVVQVMQGSFQGDDDGVLDLGHSRYKTIALPAMGFERIDHFDDGGQLDFTTWYTIKAGDREYLEHVNGWTFFSDDKFVDIPVLNVKGYLRKLE